MRYPLLMSVNQKLVFYVICPLMTLNFQRDKYLPRFIAVSWIPNRFVFFILTNSIYITTVITVGQIALILYRCNGVTFFF